MAFIALPPTLLIWLNLIQNYAVAPRLLYIMAPPPRIVKHFFTSFL